MVFYFTASDGTLLYMGRDKFENEDMIKYGFPEDVWFHVDKMSSAHVYLRMPEGMTITTIPPQLLEECSQLVKANSIQGCKEATVSVVYTMHHNLHKSPSMEVGQVGFHEQKKVYTYRVERKSTEIINRLNKTKVEKNCGFPS
eukprot:TRINITY_DN5623_c0_g1_i1.p1 TRINITY_DN5623_c0_g1~~TRINITY_DN5623_c0_g1_i1.p1  ORF type:complete len:143 (+),score=32.24 TRINITY_DN5623_c0_g1_i1:50-478(+)